MAVIDASRKIDWSPSGAGTIPNRTTIFTTLNPGATSATVNAAIAACPTNQVVFLNAGDYIFGQGLTIAKSNVTLRGAGANATFITFTGGQSGVGLWTNLLVTNPARFPSSDSPGTVANWTAGYTKGTTTITLSTVSGLTVGSLLVLDQLDDSNTDNGEVWINDTLAVATEGGSAGRVGRAQMQFVTVTGINGNQVTFNPGLYMPNWRSGQSPQAWWISPATGVGIEDLSMNHAATAGGSMSGIFIFNTVNSWVKGVRSLYGLRNHIWLYESAHITIRDSYFYGAPGSSQSYGVETRMGSDHLVENNIFQHIAVPMMCGNVSGSTFGYNFAIDDDFQTPSGWQQGSSYFHSAGVNCVLWEGNDGIGFTADNIHGTSHFGTAFRNYWNGRDIGGPTKTMQTTPIIIMAANRYMNIVGNVLGTTGYHTNYECAPVNSSSSSCGSGVGDRSIYTIGWSGNQGTKHATLPNDVLVKSTMMRWGNYDTLNAANRFQAGEVPSGISLYANPVPPDQTLPTSYYLSAAPTVFTNLGVDWPPIGPDISNGDMAGFSGHVNKIPARLCYEAGTFTNGVLNFNPAFYNGTGQVPPNLGAPRINATQLFTPSLAYQVNAPTKASSVSVAAPSVAYNLDAPVLSAATILWQPLVGPGLVPPGINSTTLAAPALSYAIGLPTVPPSGTTNGQAVNIGDIIFLPLLSNGTTLFTPGVAYAVTAASISSTTVHPPNPATILSLPTISSGVSLFGQTLTRAFVLVPAAINSGNVLYAPVVAQVAPDVALETFQQVLFILRTQKANLQLYGEQASVLEIKRMIKQYLELEEEE
jgi:hypothetical protein